MDQNTKDILETVNFIKDRMATKDDLKKFATKDELQKFATKDDVRDIVREQLEMMKADSRAIFAAAARAQEAVSFLASLQPAR